MSTTNKQFLVRTGVNLPAGTSSQAPLTFQSGQILSTPVVGSVEWDGYNLFATELSSNGTTSSSIAATVRRTLAYTDSTMLAKTSTGITALGSAQWNAVPLTNDHNIISTAATASAPYNGVMLPPAVPGRVVRIVNSAANPINVYPYIVTSTISGASSSSTTVTVSSTVGLYVGMVLTITSGTGTLSGTTSIASIVSATQFTVNSAPSVALSSATIAFYAGASSSGTTVTVGSTTGLYPGLQVTVNSGTGAFTTSAIPGTPSNYATIVSILSTSSFSVDLVPATPLSNAVITTNNTSTSINGLAANNAFTMNLSTGAEFTASSLGAWYTTSSTTTGSNNGITGTTYTPGDIIYASTATSLAGLNDVGVGNVLLSGGISTAPSYGKVNLDTSGTAHITGTLQVANGGTGTTGSGLLASGTSYNLVNTGVTTLNVGGDATTISIGAATGSTTVNNNLIVSGSLTVNGGTNTSNSTNTTYSDSVLELHKPVQVGGLNPWIPTDDGKDIGLKYHYLKSGFTHIVTAVTGGAGQTLGGLSGTAGSTAEITLANTGLILPVGTIVTLGSTLTGYAGTYRVTQSSAGYFIIASTTNTNITTIGTVTIVTSIATTSGTSSGTTATINYTGPALANGDIVTLYNITPSGYNGTYAISNVSSGSFQVTTSGSNLGVISSQGSIILSNRFAFNGWANDTSAFEFYREGYENASTNTFSGTYGTIKSGAISLYPPASQSAADITAGTSIKIPAKNVYDSTTASGTVAQGSVVNISQQTVGAVNTAITYTNLASLYINNAPAAGTNVTITNPYAIQVAAGNVLFGGDLAINGGDLTTNQTTFNHINTTATTINEYGAATSINVGAAGVTWTLGGTTGNSSLVIRGNSTTGTASILTSTGVTTANVFNTIATTGNLFGDATTVNIGTTSTAATNVNISTGSSAALSTLTFGGAVTGNIVKIRGTTSGTVNLTTDVTTGAANIFTSVTGNIYVGGAGTTLNVGTTGGASIVNIATSGTATITTGGTTGTVFNTNVTTGNLFGAATSLNISNSATTAVTASIATASTAASTLTFGGAITTGTNTVKIGSGTGGTVAFDSNLNTATATLFATTTTGTVKLSENATTVTLQNTTTSATTLNIATASGSNNNTLTYGGAGTTGTNKIVLNSGGANTVTLDAGNSGATGNIFPAITGTVNYSNSATTTNISNTTTSAVGVNIATAATGGASTLTFGGAVTGNIVKIRSTTGGTINLTTDVTTGAANIFASIQASSAITAPGTITIGGTQIGSGSGIVKLGATPALTATGTEVVTAAWVLNNVGSIGSVSTDVGNNTTSQVIDNQQTTAGIFSFGTHRSAKYIIQATQIGQTSTRSQTSELLITHDAPFVTITGVTVSNTTTVNTANTYGLYLGMTIAIQTNTPGTDVINGTPTGTAVITAITHGTSFTISANATITATSIIEAYMAGSFVDTSASQTVTAGTSINLSIFGTFTSSTNGIYPGMAIAGSGIPAGTYVTEVTATTFKLSQNITSVTSWTGTPNIWITEYGVLETNGTIATYSAAVNSSSPYNIQLTATPQSTGTTGIALGTLVKTLFKIEKEFIEFF